MIRSLVMVVDDDARTRRVLSVALQSQGYDVATAATGGDALRQIGAQAPDALILDLDLRDMDGLEVITRVRQDHTLPIIVLSARSEEEQQIHALDEGADDYVTKPFRPGELMARIRAALRRPPVPPAPAEIIIGELRIDTRQHRVFVAGDEVALTPIEFKLLHLLARQVDRVVTHQQLLREVWGPSRVDEVQYLRVYMKQLRQKLEGPPRSAGAVSPIQREGSRPRRIVTALGVGYRLLGSDSSA